MISASRALRLEKIKSPPKSQRKKGEKPTLTNPAKPIQRTITFKKQHQANMQNKAAQTPYGKIVPLLQHHSRSSDDFRLEIWDLGA